MFRDTGRSPASHYFRHSFREELEEERLRATREIQLLHLKHRIHGWLSQDILRPIDAGLHSSVQKCCNAVTNAYHGIALFENQPHFLVVICRPSAECQTFHQTRLRLRVSNPDKGRVHVGDFVRKANAEEPLERPVIVAASTLLQPLEMDGLVYYVLSDSVKVKRGLHHFEWFDPEGAPLSLFETRVLVQPVCSATTYAQHERRPEDFFWQTERLVMSSPSIVSNASAASELLVHNEWCSQQRCFYSDFQDVQSLSTLNNLTLVFMGNSHIRNLFRCTADTLSRGRSKTDPQMCEEGTRKGHCLACENYTPIHRFDYDYTVPELQLHLRDIWTVVWDMTKEARLACNATLLPATEEQRECMIHEFVAFGTYSGSRVGLDYWYEAVFPSMLSDRKVFLVMNINTRFNEPEAVQSLLEHIQRYPHIAARMLLVIDPWSTADSFALAKEFEKAGVHVLNLTWIYEAYDKAKIEGRIAEDKDGDLSYRFHLPVALNRFLLRHVLTTVTIQAWQDGIIDTPPTPHLCLK